jgi:hypothetical protein
LHVAKRFVPWLLSGIGVRSLQFALLHVQTNSTLNHTQLFDRAPFQNAATNPPFLLQLVAAFGNNTLLVWDPRTGAVLHTLKGYHLHDSVRALGTSYVTCSGSTSDSS